MMHLTVDETMQILSALRSGLRNTKENGTDQEIEIVQKAYDCLNNKQFEPIKSRDMAFLDDFAADCKKYGAN